MNKHNLKNLSDVGKKLQEDDIIWAICDIENDLKKRCKMTDNTADKFTLVLTDYFDASSNGTSYIDFLRKEM